jgi:serine-type D-Ala-D-Ala carboxypeptidase (penicillin-binding protein 5/6)
MQQQRAQSGPRSAATRTGDPSVSHTLSWALALLLTLSMFVATLTRMAASGPNGTLQTTTPRTASAASDIAFSGTQPTVTAKAAFVFDADLGLTYYAKNADLELPMASCTKIMTALLAVERGSLNQLIKVGADAAALVRPDSSYMGLKAGEQLTLHDLLYGLVLPSGNDAAVAIADAIGGSVPAFVAMMNQRAQQLGLTHTHFINPHGLGAPGHYTTAHDLAILAAVAMTYPELVQVTSTVYYTIPKTATHKVYKLHTGIDILPGGYSPYPGAIGIKPGFTGDAGYCEAFAAIRRGHLMVGVVLNEPTWQIRLADMRKLLDWGFAQEDIPAAPPPVSGTYPSANA